MTDRSLYGSRFPFVKVFVEEEKLDGILSKEVIAQKFAMGMENLTDSTCFVHGTAQICEASLLGCNWRPLFESCHPAPDTM